MAGSFWLNQTPERSSNQVKQISFWLGSPWTFGWRHNSLICSSSLHASIDADHYKAINDEGMPHHQRPFMKGKLYIRFNVEFPEPGSLSPDRCKALESILSQKRGKQISAMEVDEAEETTMYDVNMEEEMRRKQQQKQQEAYDEDDDDYGAPRVQCAQQWKCHWSRELLDSSVGGPWSILFNLLGNFLVCGMWCLVAAVTNMLRH